jgi:hypothetical protein
MQDSSTTILPERIQEHSKNYMRFLKKINKLEVLHFPKLEQQRKALKESNASRPARYSRGKPSTNNYDVTMKHMKTIDSDGCGHPGIWENFFGPSQPDHRQRSIDTRKDMHN